MGASVPLSVGACWIELCQVNSARVVPAALPLRSRLQLIAGCCTTGRLHFFFPDSRLALDLNTDKTLKVPGQNLM